MKNGASFSLYYGQALHQNRFVTNLQIMENNVKAELKADLWDALRLLMLILAIVFVFVALIIYFPF